MSRFYDAVSRVLCIFIGTQRTKLDHRLSDALSNFLVLFNEPFFCFYSLLLTSVQLLLYADHALLCQQIFSQSASRILFRNLRNSHCKIPEYCKCSFILSLWPIHIEHSVIGAVPDSRSKSLRDTGVTIRINLRLSSHI